EDCDALTSVKEFRVEGVMTHLASADDEWRQEFTDNQLSEFESASAAFRERGFQPKLIHAANSAAAFANPGARGNMVRPGGGLYGFTRDVLPSNIETPALRPVMSVHSRVMLLKKVPRGEYLGYD